MGSLVLRKRSCVLACVLCFSFICVVKYTNVTVVEGTVVIDGRKPISKTDKNFVCATMDWWPNFPPEQCNYGLCAWGNASIFNLNLNNRILFNAVKAFSLLRIRMGGTLQDRVIYQTEDHRTPCVPFSLNSSGVFGVTEGCFSLSRWDELNYFFNQTRAVITFGINALSGKYILRNNTATGPWNPRNAASFIRYTVKKGYKVYGWEHGNELGGTPVLFNVAAKPYAADTDTLHRTIQEIYENSTTKPLILAPGGNFEPNWFREFIPRARSVIVVSFHNYNLRDGTEEELIQRILDPSYLDNITALFVNVQESIRNASSSASAWVSEAGGIFHSGHDRVSNAFVNGFWYVDQLGMSSSYGTKVYCRQSLIGGNYGLLNTSTFLPNPDYYSALLWHRLMGRKVLSTKFTGTRTIRAYAHCAKKSEGVTIALINLSGNTTVKPALKFTVTGTRVSTISTKTREEYHLTAKGGNIQSQTVLLNGKALSVDSTGAIPALKPVLVKSTNPITVAPFSIVFVHMPCIVIPACKRINSNLTPFSRRNRSFTPM